MSTEYNIAPGVTVTERSSRLNLGIEREDGYLAAPAMDEITARLAIIKLVEALSYISKDPDEVLARFNVNYGDTK